MLQYSLSITEVDNWVGPDGVVKEKVMLINSKSNHLTGNLVHLKITDARDRQIPRYGISLSG